MLSLLNVMKGFCFVVFIRTVAVDQTALEVGLAGVLHRTGVCVCVCVCVFVCVCACVHFWYFYHRL